MGLRIGDEIEIITNVNQGQLVVAVDYKRLVLGRGLARKIQVVSAAGRFGQKGEYDGVH
jgi:Fur family ferric uptake transcriptional regulator